MSYLLPHLHSGYAVDQAILGEEDRVVVLRFGHDYDPQCMQVSCSTQKLVGDVEGVGGAAAVVSEAVKVVI